MKCAVRTLQEMLAVWLLCVLAGSSCAVFYTESNNNDFPRLGRRSIFTAMGGDGALPRIGRRSDLPHPHHPRAPTRLSPALPEEGMGSSLYGASLQTFPPQLHKRGIFTSAGAGYPRIGRSQAKRAHHQVSPAEVVTSVEGPDVGGRRGPGEEEEEVVQGVEAAAQFQYPLGLLFFQFDKDGDKSLSREEFVQGMVRARREGMLYR
ncbi:HCS2 neuropeptides-like [Babylonia areolata]|uniref:HCS2 neuropeptides-like n=1 Tax=Babylonia areolata TaxID=304850 RepID=UPI003FD19CC0